jgi:hypothetical protein
VADAKVKKFDRNAEKAWKERAEVGRLYWHLHQHAIVQLRMIEPIYIIGITASFMLTNTSYKQLTGLEPLDLWMLEGVT